MQLIEQTTQTQVALRFLSSAASDVAGKALRSLIQFALRRDHPRRFNGSGRLDLFTYHRTRQSTTLVVRLWAWIVRTCNLSGHGRTAMARLGMFDRQQQIEMLLRLRFGDPDPDPSSAPGVLQLSQSIAQARANYESMTDDQLAAAAELLTLRNKLMPADQEDTKDALFFDRPGAFADFGFWGKMAFWSTDESLALSLGRNPGVVNWDSLNGVGERYMLADVMKSQFRLEYAKRRELLRRAVVAQELRDQNRPETFLNWALVTFDDIPIELINSVRSTGKTITDIATLMTRIQGLEDQLRSVTAAAGRNKWPWGDHETELLRQLDAAASRFWKNFDPTDNTTAPTNERIVAWLVESGVSERLAKAIATILRADHLPSGPRK